MGHFDPAALASNTFDIEWPPRSGRRQNFPEVDRAEWFDIELARTKMLSGQVGLLDRLLGRKTTLVDQCCKRGLSV
jgi:predicted NUDIX family NTP pyrophosphohydrolase